MRKEKMKKELREMRKLLEEERDWRNHELLTLVKAQVSEEFLEVWENFVEGDEISEAVQISVKEVVPAEIEAAYQEEGFDVAVRNVIDGMPLSKDEIIGYVEEALDDDTNFQNRVVRAYMAGFNRTLPVGIGGTPGASTER